MGIEPIKLGVFSPYPEFGRLVAEISRDFPVQLIDEYAVLSEAVEKSRKWQQEGVVEAIIARGATAIMIERTVTLPVSIVDITSFDILKALYRARSSGSGPVGFVCYNYGPGKFDFDLFREMLGMDFNIYLYKNDEELNRQIDLAVEDGMRTIVAAGSCIVNKAVERGINAVFVRSNREVLTEAVDKAVRMVKIRRDDAAFTEKIRNILDAVHEGVFAVDENDRLFFFNPGAEKLMGIRSREVMGKNIRDLLPFKPFFLLYQDGEKTSGEVIRVNDQELVVNRIPIQAGMNRCLVISFQGARKIQKMEGKIRRQIHAKGLVARYHFEDIVGKSAAIRDTLKQARKYAITDSTVLITGESGTGKELFAQGIHNASRRKQEPFVAVNCAALPENLLESEFFGYEDGAFTGARRGGKLGLFELAHGGTIFLDEVGELGSQLQARLLRVIQQKEVMRLGGDRVIPVDVRVIAATNRDLRQAVAEGKFREDLYYRLNVLPLYVPPLHGRPEDIPVLFRHFLKNFWGSAVPRIPQKLLKRLKHYSWPGNIRELENFVERYYAIGEEDLYNLSTLSDLIDRLQGYDQTNFAGKKLMVEVGTIKDMEQQILNQLGRLFSNDKNELAKVLGVSRSTLWRKIKTSGRHGWIDSGS